MSTATPATPGTAPVPPASATATDAAPAPVRRTLARALVEVVLPPLVVAVVVVAGWAWAASTRPDSLLPGPDLVAGTLGRLLTDGPLLAVAGRTFGLMALGYGVSAAAGIAVGLLVAAYRPVDRGLSPYLVALQSLPSAAWVPFAVLFLGAGRTAVLAVTVLGALPSIAIGTRDSVHAVPPTLVRAARTLGARGPALLARVVVPAALPGIVTGLSNGWAFAFRSLVAGELIVGSGLGAFTTQAKAAGRIDEMLAAIAVILFVGVVVDRFGFAAAQRRMRERRGL